MRKKLGLGAGFALTAAAIAIAGCGSKKTTIVNGSSGELNNNGFPASSIATNNLASDGGGFSENNQDSDINRIKVVFNNKRPDSASANSAADGSAMVFFTTKANSSSDRELVYISYWNGSSFTPPTVITGVDRDEKVTPGTAKATHVDSVVMIPMNTSGFTDANGTANALARANNGNWLILWDAQTVSPNPLLTITAGGVGSHHTVYLNVFIKNLASQPSATTKLIGNTATTGTPNGTSQAMVNGVQASGTEAPVAGQRGGFATGETTPGTFVGGFAAGGTIIRPASDIGSYGAASDTFVHCADFQGSKNNVSGIAANGLLGTSTTGAFVVGPSSTAGAGGTVEPAAAQYSVGDNTSFIQLFWTQLITSGDTGGSSVTLAPATGAAATVQLGPNWQFLTANFNLASMTIGGASNPNAITAVKQVPYTASLNSGLAGLSSSAVQANTEFVTYNNLVFWSFTDASLKTSTGTPGVNEASISGQVSTVLSVVAVNLGVGGASDISTGANQTDITVLGTSGRHLTTTNSTTTNFGNESVQISGLCASNIDGCPIIGPDEGAADVTIFVVGSVSTFTSNAVSTGANNAGNTDNELWAAVLQQNGSTAGTLLGANNPRRVSFHQAELTSTSTGVTTSLADPVVDVKLNISRDGTYALLGWRQAIGTSAVPTLALECAAYRVNVAAVNSGSGAASNANAPTLDQRLSGTPVVVNSNANATSATSVAYSGQTNPGFNGQWNGSPVAAYDFQNHIGYRRGFQGLATRTAVLYVYADGTEDRAFVNSINVTLPTTVTSPPAASTSGEAELESGASVPGVQVNNGTSISKTNFRFLPGSHGLVNSSPLNGTAAYNDSTKVTVCSSLLPQGATTFSPGQSLADPTTFKTDRFDTIDAGSTASTSQGDVLIVFSKIVDASQGSSSNSTSGNFFDRQILAVLYVNGTLTGPVILSRNSVEQTSTTTTVGTNTVPNNFRRQLIGLVGNPQAVSNTAGKGVSPANGTYIYFYDMATTNPNAARGLFTRHFRARTALATNATQPALGDVFFPTADTTFSAKNVDPLEIDTLDDSDVTFGTTLIAGRQAVVLFAQDNHLWGTVTSDGESYTSTGGRSTPFLVDNNISANSVAPPSNTISLYVAPKIDSNGDNLHGTGLLIVKDDVNLNDRIFVRVMQ